MSETRKEQCYYGCLFCVTGREEEVARELEQRMGVRAIAPVRQHYFRRQGSFEVLEDRVFPGYVFFASDDPDIPVQQLSIVERAIRVIRYDAESWVLRGDDAKLAERLFKCGGVIELSRARFVDGRLRILDGFLKPYENDIRKVDRRHRVAMVKTRINDREVEMWLGYFLDEE